MLASCNPRLKDTFFALLTATECLFESIIITHFYFALSDLLYVLGGECDGAVVDTVKSFDISTQKWSTLPSMREKRANPGACMRGYQIVACGGWRDSQPLATCEQFDSTLQRWVIETQFIKIITHLNAQSKQLPLFLPSQLVFSASNEDTEAKPDTCLSALWRRPGGHWGSARQGAPRCR